ncbi:MAG: hypothetical protein KJ634_11780 [Gammaproteobacteria bacterium]|nr:hypothetical protein [Gammaproteobacteria bacterium]MBU1416295.1 hypothetical protein [Gammaproteobacteria bacterium]
MIPGDAERLIADVVAAHGGETLWRSLAAIEAVLSVDGFLFTAKRIKPLRRQRVSASTTEARFTFFDWPLPGQRGEWIGEEEVRIVTGDGTPIARREQPRSAFRGLRRELWWDNLDFLFFAGYATWNYLTTPFVFLRPGFRFEVLPSAADGITRVRAVFPDDVPSHCREQVFHFAPGGELLRLDYTAEVVGGWARAAHLCVDYRDFDGLRAPATRRVRPLFHFADPLPFPTLVAIDVHELRPVKKAG